MSDLDPPRPRFDQTAFTILEEACRAAAAAVPELEGVAVIALWRFPDQKHLPSTLIVGARGPLATPDQIARLAAETIRLQHHLADAYAESFQTLRGLEARLAGFIDEQRAVLGRLREEIARAREEAAPVRGDAAAAAPEAPPAHEP